MQLDIEDLKDCTKCSLHKHRTQVVEGYGNTSARIMLLGQGPGKNEDLEGRPFIGAAGRYLDELLSIAGISREDVFITNSTKCLSPSNRKPTPIQVNTCTSLWLYKEIELIDPKIIITLGDVALGVFFPHFYISAVHGRALQLTDPATGSNRIIVPWYHPAASFNRPGNPRAHEIKQALEEDARNFYNCIISPASKIKIVPNSYEVTDQGIQKLANKLSIVEAFSIDLETSSLDPNSGEIISCSISTGEETYFIQTDPELLVYYLKPLFANPNITKVLQNAGFDLSFLEMIDPSIHVNNLFDTMIMAYILNKPLGLKDLVLLEFNVLMTRIEELIGSGKKQKRLDQAPRDQWIAYSNADAYWTYRLYDKWSSLFDLGSSTSIVPGSSTSIVPGSSTSTWVQNIYGVDSRIFNITRAMTKIGIKTDKDKIIDINKQLLSRLNKYKEAILTYLAMPETDIDSNSKLGKVLAEELNIKLPKTPVTKKPSVSKLALRNAKHEIIPWIQKYKELSTLINNFSSKLPDYVHEDDRIRATFNLTRTKTGRLSCSQPNLQQVPARSVDGKELRHAFIPADNYKFIIVDYAGHEVVLTTHFSQDPELIYMLKNNIDVHGETAKLIYLTVDESNPNWKDYRFRGKSLFFCILYGGGINRIVQEFNVNEYKARQLLDIWRSKYKRAKEWIEEVKQQALKDGHVETILGRHIPVYRDKIMDAIDYKVQGSSSDIVKLSMIALNEVFINSNFLSRIVLQIHDELLIETYNKEVDRVYDLVQNIMPNIVPLSVPMPVDITIANSWGEK